MLNRLFMWSFAAAFCIPIYFAATWAGAPYILVLLLTFAGAIAGSAVAFYLKARAQGGEGPG